MIGNLLGQSGNNFFQIATTQALAWDNGAEAFFPQLASLPTLYQHYFSRCKLLPPNEPVSYNWIEPNGKYNVIPYQSGMSLSGYLQSFKYFDRYKERLIKLFAPTVKDLKYIEKKYGNLLNQENTVGVQLRYYFEDPYTFHQYGRDFFEKAMSLFPENSIFIVSSNRIVFAKQEIPQEKYKVIFLEHEADYIEFHLLSLCKHNIISNSTFGWWSAYLNKNPNQIVVCPRIWNALEIPDIPEDWIQLEAERIDPSLIK